MKILIEREDDLFKILFPIDGNPARQEEICVDPDSEIMKSVERCDPIAFGGLSWSNWVYADVPDEFHQRLVSEVCF